MDSIADTFKEKLIVFPKPRPDLVRVDLGGGRVEYREASNPRF
jgi:hypothetical protein